MKKELADDKQKLFMELYDPINQRLSNFCYSRTNNQDDAKDLMSETIIRAYENFGTLENEKAFLSFLFSIAVRIIHKKERQHKFKGIFFKEKAEKIPSNYVSPELSHDIKVLYNALEKLPRLQKESIILFEISGFSLNEIKEIQGGSLSAIKSRISRGREKLKRILNSDRLYQCSGINEVKLNQ